MSVDNEYFHSLRRLYDKSLILESIGDFHDVLYFYWMDAVAHIDFTLCILAFNYQSPRNLMNMQYMRWRIDQEKVGDRARFGEFINWLKQRDPDKFDSLPALWKEIYDDRSPASYRSFRISLDPNSTRPLPPAFFHASIEEFFSREFLKSIYKGGSLATLFEEFIASGR
jgi:hypothetical protein